MNEPLEKLLESIYLSISETDFSNPWSLCRENNFGDLIFTLIGDLLDEDNFEEVDNLLKIVDFNRLESYSITMFLSIMHPYDRSRLSNWREFYDNCKIALLKTETTERTALLLKGFDKDPPVGAMNILNYKGLV
jgi:hypothetical protein